MPDHECNERQLRNLNRSYSRFTKNRRGMRLYLVTLTTILLVIFCKVSEADPQHDLLINKLDHKIITRNLPLQEKEIFKSGNGRVKQLWKIRGPLIGNFEIIGNNQNDADSIGWNCSEYDKQGTRLKASDPKRSCHKFFVKVLKNIVTSPEALAIQLLTQGEASRLRVAIYKFHPGDISIETDGEFYAVRRISRMNSNF